MCEAIYDVIYRSFQGRPEYQYPLSSPPVFLISCRSKIGDDIDAGRAIDFETVVSRLTQSPVGIDKVLAPPQTPSNQVPSFRFWYNNDLG